MRFIVLLLVAAASVAAPSSPADAPYAFTVEGNRYTFTSRFLVNASADEVLEVLYPFPNMQQYSRTATAVELLDEGTNWQTFRFTYSTWLWSLTTTFRREIDRPNHRIRFRMLDAQRTGLPIPLPTVSSGEYRVEPVDGGVRVTYVQMAETSDTLLLRPWMARAHSEAIQFSRDLEAFVRTRFPAS